MEEGYPELEAAHVAMLHNGVVSIQTSIIFLQTYLVPRNQPICKSNFFLQIFLPSGDEAVCRTHLQSFSQLAEIGFPSKDVHEALIQHSFDHQKALDQLIT